VTGGLTSARLNTGLKCRVRTIVGRPCPVMRTVTAIESVWRASSSARPLFESVRCSGLVAPDASVVLPAPAEVAGIVAGDAGGAAVPGNRPPWRVAPRREWPQPFFRLPASRRALRRRLTRTMDAHGLVLQKRRETLWLWS
jgi:hypothetical protein